LRACLTMHRNHPQGVVKDDILEIFVFSATQHDPSKGPPDRSFA